MTNAQQVHAVKLIDEIADHLLAVSREHSIPLSEGNDLDMAYDKLITVCGIVEGTSNTTQKAKLP